MPAFIRRTAPQHTAYHDYLQILFIRHGETDWNRIKRIQGHVDIPLVRQRDLAQAEQLARRADARLEARRAPRCGLFERPAARAADGAVRSPMRSACRCSLSEGLRERSYGAFQATTATKSTASFPEEYVEWQTRDPGFAPPEGESQRVFYHRVLHAIEPLVAAHPGGRIACVAHGGVLDCIYRFAMRLSLQEAPREPRDTSVNVLDYDDGMQRWCRGISIDHRAPATGSRCRNRGDNRASVGGARSDDSCAAQHGLSRPSARAAKPRVN